jgi:hypothetical protein
MRFLGAFVFVLAACGTSDERTEPDDAALMGERVSHDGEVPDAGATTVDASPSDGEVPDAGATTVDATPNDGGGAPDASLSACEAGLVEDGAHCIGWRRASTPQWCLTGPPSLVRTEIWLPWTPYHVLAVACEGEPLQLYWPDRDRWERATDVDSSPVDALPPSLEGAVAEAEMADGTRVAIVGSLHAHPPYATWIKTPPVSKFAVSVWRRSIDAPSVWVTQAAAIGPEALLFVGGDALVFVRRPRAE